MECKCKQTFSEAAAPTNLKKALKRMGPPCRGSIKRKVQNEFFLSYYYGPMSDPSRNSE
ncbi:hypothetical protein CRG98_029058 [Punica granatum]|uniref:Uncharacterized protein n=1 Tax=Punica granatum TaxID=22663 RepID=A0A2I0J2V2_PUNGR|nr:hypothetical protein CRG98_029058 [Punica granatum]